MVAVTATEFLSDVRFQSFTMFSESELNSILQMVEANYCPATKWTSIDRQVEGVKLRTAHVLTVSLIQAANSAAIGQAISTGQAPPALSAPADDLESTAWGREFKNLRRTLPTSTGFSLFGAS